MRLIFRNCPAVERDATSCNFRGAYPANNYRQYGDPVKLIRCEIEYNARNTIAARGQNPSRDYKLDYADMYGVTPRMLDARGMSISASSRDPIRFPRVTAAILFHR